jgi:hypothetical protein
MKDKRQIKLDPMEWRDAMKGDRKKRPSKTSKARDQVSASTTRKRPKR